MDGRHRLRSRFRLAAGCRVRVSVLYRPPEILSGTDVEIPDARELDRRLEATIRWWRSWSERLSFDGPLAAEVKHSAIVLKALTTGSSVTGTSG